VLCIPEQHSTDPSLASLSPGLGLPQAAVGLHHPLFGVQGAVHYEGVADIGPRQLSPLYAGCTHSEVLIAMSSVLPGVREEVPEVGVGEWGGGDRERDVRRGGRGKTDGRGSGPEHWRFCGAS
jgi:hypothetical protein